MATGTAQFRPGGVQVPANEPALLSREGLVDQAYHYWRGASGARYLHSVFSLRECPALPKANYIMVRREADGMRIPLHIGQTVADAASLNLAHLRHTGARLGANEIHIHLLADTRAERNAVEEDLATRQLGRIRAARRTSAANDTACVAC